MPRQPILIIGVVALTLSFVTAPSVAAQAIAEPPAHVETAKAKDEPKSKSEHAVETAHAIAAGTEHAAHAASTDPDILEPQPSLAIWTVIVFLGLLALLGKYAWGPLLDALHHREEHLLTVLHDTERARNESEAMLAEHKKRLEAAEDQIRAMIDEGRRNAQAIADQIAKKAQAEAEATKERAQRDIGTARDQALSELWSKTADLAVSVAGKVLDKSITGDDHRRLIETAIQSLPASNGATNGHGA